MHTLLTDLVAAGQRSFPSITIMAHLARAMPERAHNMSHLRDLIKKAEAAVKKLPADADTKHLLKTLSTIEASEDFTTLSSDGLAIIINKELHQVIPLFGAAEDYVHVGHYFALSKLAAHIHDQTDYVALVISEERARLYRMHYAKAEEVITPLRDEQGKPLQGFPLTAIRPEDRIVASVGIGDRDSGYRDAEINRFVRLVASELHRFTNKQPLPVVICGSSPLLQEVEDALHGKVAILARVIGDYINEMPDFIGKLAWHMVMQLRGEQIKHLLREFQEAAGHNKQACGIMRTWETVHVGRVNHLFVEQGAVVSGRIDPENSDQLQLMAETDDLSCDNVMDILIAEAINHKGLVTIVPSGSLEECEGVGALLRY
jgi:hypothetical protein